MSNEILVCFDYGEKRIGVAIGQTLTGTATPCDTIRVINGKPDWPMISKLMEQWNPQAAIIGMPLNMDGSRQNMTDSAEKFARQVQSRYRLPVHFHDERLSSFEAKQRLKDNKGLDPVAAQIILESWLTEHAK